MKNTLLNLTITGICLSTTMGGIAQAATKGEPAMALPKLHEINTNEIEAGNMAARRACDPEVRGLGKLIVQDHKSLDASLRQTAREQVIPLGEIRVDAWEQMNFTKQTREIRKLRGLRDCSLDMAYLSFTRDAHMFAGGVVDEALADPMSAPIRNVLLETRDTDPTHYDQSVRLIDKLNER